MDTRLTGENTFNTYATIYDGVGYYTDDGTDLAPLPPGSYGRPADSFDETDDTSRPEWAVLVSDGTGLMGDGDPAEESSDATDHGGVPQNTGQQTSNGQAPDTKRPNAIDVPDELVALATAGDQAAVSDIMRIIRPYLVRFCSARLGRLDRSFADGDELAQDVCIAVMAALPTYKPQGKPFIAFVSGIAAKKAVDKYRAAKRNRSEPVDEVPDTEVTENIPQERVEYLELNAQMAGLLDELTPTQREILILRILMGLSAEETAVIVGSTAGAVRVMQHRALARLRGILTGKLPRGTAKASGPNIPAPRQSLHDNLPKTGADAGSAAGNRPAGFSVQTAAVEQVISAKHAATRTRLHELLLLARADVPAEEADTSYQQAVALGAMVTRLTTLQDDKRVAAYLSPPEKLLVVAGYMTGQVRPGVAGDIMGVSYQKLTSIGAAVTQLLKTAKHDNFAVVDQDELESA
jgi:RNA polymerase sigma-70 factor (ECF subfamily)